MSAPIEETAEQHAARRAEETRATARFCNKAATALFLALFLALMWWIWRGDYRPLLTVLVLLSFIGAVAWGNTLPDSPYSMFDRNDPH